MTAKQIIDLGSRRPKGTGRRYAYDVLRRRILTLDLPPGAMLDEAMLVEQIGLSRTLVREALISLSAEELVELLPNRGARVAQLDLDGVRAFHEALELDQRAVTRWAAVRRRPEHLKAIQHERLAFEEARKRSNADAMIESNREFHVAIAEACGNTLVARSYARLLTIGLRLSRIIVSYDVNRDGSLATHLDRIVDQHRMIETAIVKRDAARAERLGAAHAHLSLDRAIANMRETLSGDVTLPLVS
jgi:DNA-binding GntR family transcriptional regulator